MPITTVAVTCTAARPDGSLIAGGKFRFLLSNTDTENGLVVPREISATANAQGVAVANLWPNSLGALGTQYRVLLTDPLGSTIDLGSCTVPTSACNLHAILGLGTAPTLDQATVAKLAAQTAAAASSTSATQSASSATQAATSATAAAGSATAAANSATSAAGSVTSAANSATAAGNSATSAASSAADALSSKNAAATSATNAASSVTNAAASATSAQTSATNAATSATTATTKASEAATSASNAATSATTALASQNAAATSETNAQGSATTAATQAGNAASSATNAASSASSAASSAAAVAAVTTGNMSSQDANAVAVTGGAISGTSITVKDDVFTLQDNIDPTKQAQFQLSGLTTGTTRAYTLPDTNGTLVTLNTTASYTGVLTFNNANQNFGSSTATGTQQVAYGATVSGATKTVNIGTGGLSGSTTAITVGGTAGTSTTTMNGQTDIGGTTTSVNFARVTGAATGAAPTISAQGSDANIGLKLSTKGTGRLSVPSAATVGNATDAASQFAVSLGTGYSPGNAWTTNSATFGGIQSTGSSAAGAVGIAFDTTNGGWISSVAPGQGYYALRFDAQLFDFVTTGARQFRVQNTGSSVNYVQATGAVTTGAPELSAQGSDTNIGLVLTGKGTGVVALGGTTTANSGLQVSPVASSVNYALMTGATTGTFPSWSAQGTDTNIGFRISTKGIANINFMGSNFGQYILTCNPVSSAVNFLQVLSAATTAAPELSSQGSDANINLKLTAKGTGVLQFGTYTAGVVAQAGFITITDAGGTSRRLLVG